MRDQYFMSLALDQARRAAALGEIPVGAVVVRNGLVIATGCNAAIKAGPNSRDAGSGRFGGR